MTRSLAGGAPPGLEALWSGAVVIARHGGRRGVSLPPLRWERGAWYATVRWDGPDGQPDYHAQPERVRLRDLVREEAVI